MVCLQISFSRPAGTCDLSKLCHDKCVRVCRHEFLMMKETSPSVKRLVQDNGCLPSVSFFFGSLFFSCTQCCNHMSAWKSGLHVLFNKRCSALAWCGYSTAQPLATSSDMTKVHMPAVQVGAFPSIFFAVCWIGSCLTQPRSNAKRLCGSIVWLTT